MSQPNEEAIRTNPGPENDDVNPQPTADPREDDPDRASDERLG